MLGLLIGAFGVGFLVAKQRLFSYEQLVGAEELRGASTPMSGRRHSTALREPRRSMAPACDERSACSPA